jgi:hypothetical protein
MVYFYYLLRYNQFNDIYVEIIVLVLNEEIIEFL